jgi:hypothetical protein
MAHPSITTGSATPQHHVIPDSKIITPRIIPAAAMFPITAASPSATWKSS